MPYAITLLPDPDSAASIEHLWRTLAADGIDTERHNMGYEPHLTLAVYPDDVSADRLGAGFANVTARWQARPVTLSAIGIFPGPSSIIWAAPVVTRELLAMHGAVSDALPDLPVHPHYRPASWVPHITLTGPVPDPVTALNALLPHWRQITGMLVRADLVRFRPVEVLRSQVLPAAHRVIS